MQIHIKVFGRVQGVGYRAWTVRQAQKLNLSVLCAIGGMAVLKFWRKGKLKPLILCWKCATRVRHGRAWMKFCPNLSRMHRCPK